MNQVERVRRIPHFVRPPASTSQLPEAKRILFIGRVVPSKGLATLSRAMQSVDATLEVCGDGWWLARAKALAGKLGVEKRVEFQGWTTGAGLARAYERATVLAMPSLAPETFGLVGLEAMAHGRPVVASETGAISEWLEDGKTGVLVKPGDHRELAAAVAWLLEDHAAAQRMGEVAAQHARAQFSEENYRRAIIEVYTEAQAYWYKEMASAKRLSGTRSP
jgi:glycosyltransferase involved in cell wall biosynthesis